jgi:hypothetical protein
MNACAPPRSSLGKRLLSGFIALVISGCLWLACLSFFFTHRASEFYRASGLSPRARSLANHQMDLWATPALRERELQKMRASNAEWDFMGRSFFVWSLANMALTDPSSKTAHLEIIDQIIDETTRLESEKGMYFFLMPYARLRPFVKQPAHSLFLDGEIALMMAARCLVEPHPRYETLLQERVGNIVQRFEGSSRLALESYPNECWMFDHVLALVAIRAADKLSGADHSVLIQKWLTMAREKLVHRESGLLISSFTTDLSPLDGPEGSSIWMIAHCLQVLDEKFARDQFERARRELARTTLGFSYAREWPDSWRGTADIDSGPIIPVFKISAGSSGMAFIGAAAFHDESLISTLTATLDFAGFPAVKAGRLHYCASNQVGDAALLYAATLGPLWEKILSTTNSRIELLNQQGQHLSISSPPLEERLGRGGRGEEPDSAVPEAFAKP